MRAFIIECNDDVVGVSKDAGLFMRLTASGLDVKQLTQLGRATWRPSETDSDYWTVEFCAAHTWLSHRGGVA